MRLDRRELGGLAVGEFSGFFQTANRAPFSSRAPIAIVGSLMHRSITSRALEKNGKAD